MLKVFQGKNENDKYELITLFITIMIKVFVTAHAIKAD